MDQKRAFSALRLFTLSAGSFPQGCNFVFVENSRSRRFRVLLRVYSTIESFGDQFISILGNFDVYNVPFGKLIDRRA
jgi:hypothetical protein